MESQQYGFAQRFHASFEKMLPVLATRGGGDGFKRIDLSGTYQKIRLSYKQTSRQLDDHRESQSEVLFYAVGICEILQFCGKKR